MIRSAIVLTLLLTPTITLAHSGGTDSRGGHECETNCERHGMRYGQYHFHTATMNETQLKRYNRFRESICNRVQRRFSKSPTTFERVNRRVENRFGFTCGGLASAPRPTFTEMRRRLRAEENHFDSVSHDRATVNRVLDGDTLEVLIGSKKETVRIIGIDAPEIEGYGQHSHCYSGEAFMYVRDLLTNNRVELQHRPGDNRDKYARLLRYVHFRGKDIGYELLKLGLARNYPWFEHPRSQQYVAAEIAAQQGEYGLWGACLGN